MGRFAACICRIQVKMQPLFKVMTRCFLKIRFISSEPYECLRFGSTPTARPSTTGAVFALAGA